MKKKIAIIHPKIGWGGSEVTVLWMIDALKSDYSISLITCGNVDIDRLNSFYGTKLRQEDFSIIQVPLPILIKNTNAFAGLRGRFIQRYCQKISHEFDLMINAYNLCDFKTKGIQFATDIDELTNILTLSGFKKIWYGKSILRKIYLGLCDLVSADNIEEWKKNITLSNSDWTAELVNKKYGIKATTLYPPVVYNFTDVPYEARELGFVCIGRIVPEKRIEMAINILEQVRRDGHNVQLHIIGAFGDKKYKSNLKRLCSKNKDWVFLNDKLGQEDKKNIIASHKFGISCRKNEPFGIAVAEMVKAGCIVFVPDGGGQTEIVRSPSLIYKDVSDAVEKIENILNDKQLQTEIRKQLLITANKFSVDTFAKEIRNIVHEFLKEKQDNQKI